MESSKCQPWEDLLALVIRWQQHHPSPSVRRCAIAVEQLGRLSPRELRVFHSLGKGMHNKEIARDLRLRVNTVETYRKIISAKLASAVSSWFEQLHCIAAPMWQSNINDFAYVSIPEPPTPDAAPPAADC